MSLAECRVAAPTVSLADLLSGSRPPLTGTTELSLVDYAQEITRSGFPAIRQLSGRLLDTQLDGYLQRIVERDFLELGHRVRNRDALRRWFGAYAAASSTTASYETIRDAASPGEANNGSCCEDSAGGRLGFAGGVGRFCRVLAGGRDACGWWRLAIEVCDGRLLRGEMARC